MFVSLRVFPFTSLLSYIKRRSRLAGEVQLTKKFCSETHSTHVEEILEDEPRRRHFNLQVWSSLKPSPNSMDKSTLVVERMMSEKVSKPCPGEKNPL